MFFSSLNTLKEEEFDFLRARKLQKHGFHFYKLQNPRKNEFIFWQAKKYFNFL